MTFRILRARTAAAAAVLLLPLLLAACDQDSGQGKAQASAGERPPVPVSVVEVRPEPVPIVNELPGRIAPTRIAEVRPRVSGIVVERVFEQGSTVREGDVLYRIDPEPFRVQVQSAQATLERAKAVQLQARQQAERQKELRSRKVASAATYDDAVAALAQANADVALAQANLAAAQLNLQYSEVKAPISGRVGRALVTEGALVVANSPDSMAIIAQLDPVYADFTQSANQLMQLRRAFQSGAVTSGQEEAPVRLQFDDGTPYPHQGRLLFSESSVDVSTGQVTLRGEFPNPDNELLPGMYVRVVIEQGVQRDALAVPVQAVQRDGSGNAQLYIVGADGKAELRTVRAGRVVGQRWVIDEGLAPGEQVVVEGFQKIRPGTPVAPQPWGQGAATAEGAQAQAGTAG